MTFKVFLVLWFQAPGEPPEMSRTEMPDIATCLDEVTDYAGQFLHEVDESSVYIAACQIVAMKTKPA